MANIVPVRTGIVSEPEGGVKGSLARRPLLVLFFMTGCSHCEANQPKWEEFKRKYSHIPSIEVESSNVPPSENVSGFPTMKYKPRKGRERVLVGQQSSSSEIARKLGLLNRLTRRSSRRRSRHVSRRRISH